MHTARSARRLTCLPALEVGLGGGEAACGGLRGTDWLLEPFPELSGGGV